MQRDVEQIEQLKQAARRVGALTPWGEEVDPHKRAVEIRPERVTTGLCERCTDGWVYTRDRGEPAVYCLTAAGEPVRVPPDVTFCNRHNPKSRREALDLEELARMAATVDPREGPPGRGGYL